MIENMGIGVEIVERYGGYGFNGYIFTRVTRETRTQWVCENGSRYRKDTQSVVGGYGRMILATDNHREANRIYNVKAKITKELYELNHSRNHIEIDGLDDLKEVYLLLTKVREILFKANK